MEDMGYFSRLACTDLFSYPLPVSGVKNVLLFLVLGGYGSHGKFYELFLGKRSRSESPSFQPAISQVPSAQNQYTTKGSCFEVVCPALSQTQLL